MQRAVRIPRAQLLTCQPRPVKQTQKKERSTRRRRASGRAFRTEWGVEQGRFREGKWRLSGPALQEPKWPLNWDSADPLGRLFPGQDGTMENNVSEEVSSEDNKGRTTARAVGMGRRGGDPRWQGPLVAYSVGVGERVRERVQDEDGSRDRRAGDGAFGLHVHALFC